MHFHDFVFQFFLIFYFFLFPEMMKKKNLKEKSKSNQCLMLSEKTLIYYSSHFSYG